MSEPNYMQAAAEKAIRDLQTQVNNAEYSAAAAQKSADSVASSAKRWKVLTIVLGAAVVLLLVLVGFGAKLYMDQNSSTSQLRQQAINGCMTGNARAAADKAHWDLFLVLALKGNTDPSAPAKAKQLSDSIAESDAPRDCHQAYGQ